MEGGRADAGAGSCSWPYLLKNVEPDPFFAPDHTAVYHDLGPQSQRVYTALRDAILRGDYAPGARLPGYMELAEQFGVAAVTVRQVLARLEQEGLLTRQQGRGTFVRASVAPTVLIVDDDPQLRALLRTYTTRAGHRVVEATGPAEALEILARDGSITLVLSDVRLPTPSDGVTFIRTVKRRWPEVPLAAITASPDDLAELHGRPECPVLILARPVWEHQVRDVFHWVLASRPQPPAPDGTEP